jgi:hypothetical protein
MAVLPSTAAWQLHNCCADGGTSLETFGSTLVGYDIIYIDPVVSLSAHAG